MKFSFFLVSILVISVSLNAQNTLEEAKTFYESNQTEKAKTVLENILDQEESAEANYYLGLIYFTKENNPDEAEDYLEAASELDPDNAQYHYILGALYGRLAQTASIFSQLSLAGSCKDEFEKAVELDPKLLPARVGLIQYLIQAPGIAGGSLEEAKTHIEALKDIDLATHYSFKASLASEDENYDEAESYFLKALEIDSTNIGVLNSLGYLYLQAMNKPDNAITQFKKMVELKPEIANCHDSLGDGYKGKKMYKEALDCYSKALKLDPDFQSSLFNVAQMYELLGEKGKAKEGYKRYLSKYEDGNYADAAEDRLNSIE